METITLTLEKSLLDEVQKAAEAQHTTLDALLQEWLASLSAGAERVRKHDEVMERMKHVNAGRKFTRDEMNERR